MGHGAFILPLIIGILSSLFVNIFFTFVSDRQPKLSSKMKFILYILSFFTAIIFGLIWIVIMLSINSEMWNFLPDGLTLFVSWFLISVVYGYYNSKMILK